MRRLLRIAITGGIASGKSHVASRLRHHGIPTIDADAIVHELLASDRTILARIAERFGVETISGGVVDRRALGRRVFQDAGARRDLEALLHPLVYARLASWCRELEQDGRYRAAAAEVPLLYETGHERDFDRVIVAACGRDQQVHRSVTRDGITAAEVEQRIAAQMPLEQKIQRADIVVWTDGALEQTDRQVDDALRALLGNGS